MTPEISVIVPTCRREKELAEALGSVLAQEGARLQVIVVDDSHEGSARDVVARINDQRVSYMRNPTPTGGNPSIVRNLALPHARAPLLHFLDDDDLVPAGHYARAMSAFAANADVGLIFGTVAPFGSGPAEQLQHEQQYFAQSHRLAVRCRGLATPLAFVGALLFVRALLVCSAGMVRREAALALRGFDARLRVREDVDFYALLIRQFGVRFIDEVSLHYRISSNGSLMHTAFPTPAELESRARLLRDARSITDAKYIARWGRAEFTILKALSRTLLRLL
jgi:glycosyltransferase involved in cell wall biosynthesis